MRKISFLFALVLIIAGCQKEKELTDEQLAKMPQPQTTGLPKPSGGMVITVDNESITSDEVIDALADKFAGITQNSTFEIFKKQSRPEIEGFVTGKIAGIIVYKHAKRNAGEQVDQRVNQVVDAEVKDYIAQFGGDYAAAEDALKKDGFSNWQDFRDYKKKLILSQSYLASQIFPQQPVTYSEMLSFYNKVKADDYTTTGKISFQLIDIQPAKMINPDPNVQVLQSARQLAESLVSRIKSGEDFTALAKQYSHGTGAAETGGIFAPVEPNSLAKPYDELAKLSQKVQTGEIAGPVETGDHIFIMKLLEKQTESAVPFEKVQGEIKSRILVERRNKFYSDLNEKIARQASVANRDDFVDYCLVKIYEKNNKLLSGR